MTGRSPMSRLPIFMWGVDMGLLQPGRERFVIALQQLFERHGGVMVSHIHRAERSVGGACQREARVYARSRDVGELQRRVEI